MKRIICLFAIVALLANCAGNAKKNNHTQEVEYMDQQEAEYMDQLEKQLSQMSEPLEKYKLLDKTAKERAKTLSPEDFGAFFMLFREQMDSVMAEIYAKESEHQPDAEAWAAERGKIYTDAELSYSMSEGMVYSVHLPDDYFSYNFEKYLPQDYKDFLHIQKMEFNDDYCMIEDVTFWMTHHELVNFILGLEDFIEKHPNSKMINEIKEKYFLYQSAYLLGIDYSPTMNYESGKLLPESKTEFSRFIKAHPDSKTALLAKELLEEKRSGFENLYDWLKKQ